MDTNEFYDAAAHYRQGMSRCRLANRLRQKYLRDIKDSIWVILVILLTQQLGSPPFVSPVRER